MFVTCICNLFEHIVIKYLLCAAYLILSRRLNDMKPGYHVRVSNIFQYSFCFNEFLGHRRAIEVLSFMFIHKETDNLFSALLCDYYGCHTS